MKQNIKKGDTVLVLSGKDKGAKGKVLSYDPNPEHNFAKVDGVNIIQKHQKAKKQGASSGIIKEAGNIHVSNLQVICQACNKPTRIARIRIKEGDKEKSQRTCKHCGASLDIKKAAAKKEKKGKEKEPKTETKKKPAKKEKEAKE